MRILTMPKPRARKRVCQLLAAGAVICSGEPALAQPLFPPEIVKAAVQGFGDRHNSQAWAMIWWNNRLYVGTGRATLCTQAATLAYFWPTMKSYYPPHEEDTECPPDPQDIPLQAEIWRWTPETGAWDRVYQSPKDVPIQGTDPVKYTARDTGYRGATVFREADGTEALYVAGVSARAAKGSGIHGPVPPPRILRSTDGEHFAPLPQDPGTFLGDTLVSGFRTLLSYKGRLYGVGSVGQLGHGIIVEAERPELGNDAFRQVSPPGLTFFELETYNGFLWAGTGVQPTISDTPFSLMKTDASGTPPYTFTTVIPPAAFRKTNASPAVISLHEFKGRLYVGTDRELLRVNPDDTWDLVVGTPRKTPSGFKLEPLSGFDVGFDNVFGIHMWRMGDYDGWLYVGTQDQSTKWRNADWGALIMPRLGFDLYGTSDGWHYSMISRTGLGDKFNSGMRNFAATPYGLFMGTANHYYGTWIYRAVNVDNPLAAPQRLAVESSGKVALLSWEGSPGLRFHVYRDVGFSDPREIGVVGPLATPLGVFVDNTAKPPKQYHYFVVAEDALGSLSDPSNMVRVPFKGPIPTFASLQALLGRWSAPPLFTDLLASARAAVEAGDYATALTHLGTLQRQAENPTLLPPWRGEDLGILLAKFIRRVTLARASALPPTRLTR